MANDYIMMMVNSKELLFYSIFVISHVLVIVSLREL